MRNGPSSLQVCAGDLNGAHYNLHGFRIVARLQHRCSQGSENTRLAVELVGFLSCVIPLRHFLLPLVIGQGRFGAFYHSDDPAGDSRVRRAKTCKMGHSLNSRVAQISVVRRKVSWCLQRRAWSAS